MDNVGYSDICMHQTEFTFRCDEGKHKSCKMLKNDTKQSKYVDAFTYSFCKETYFLYGVNMADNVINASFVVCVTRRIHHFKSYFICDAINNYLGTLVWFKSKITQNVILHSVYLQNNFLRGINMSDKVINTNFVVYLTRRIHHFQSQSIC